MVESGRSASARYDAAASAVDEAGGVLPGHDRAVHVAVPEGLERLEDLELLVADGLPVDVRRGLHGDQAEQLEQVVLHHVAQRAGAVVVAAAAADAERLRRGDLHVVDGVGVPERLEERVGEAGDQEVLDALLAEVVVDPEDLVLLEHGADRVVDLAGRGQVVAERLLEHQARGGRHQAVLGEPLADPAEQRRADRQVEHPDPVADRELLDEGRPARLVVDVEADVGQPVDEPLDGGAVVLGVQLGGPHEAGELAADLVAVAGLVETGAGDRDDAGLRRQLAVAVAEVEGGEELADGQVAGAAEDDEVAGRDGSGGGAGSGGHRNVSLGTGQVHVCRPR